MTAGLFTVHDLFGAWLLGIALGLLAGAVAVAAVLSWLCRSVDTATTLPAPGAVTDDEALTARIDTTTVHDLRRGRSTFEEIA